MRYVHPGGIEEHYEMRAEGVEQSYRFAQPPAGSGDSFFLATGVFMFAIMTDPCP